MSKYFLYYFLDILHLTFWIHGKIWSFFTFYDAPVKYIILIWINHFTFCLHFHIIYSLLMPMCYSFKKTFFFKYDFELFFNLVCTLYELCSFAVMWSSWVSCSLAATVARCCISRFYPQLLLFRMQRVYSP